MIRSFASCLDDFNRPSKKKVKFNQALMESLLSNTFIQVVASCRVKEFCSHLGMSAIATSLWGELRSLLHDYLPNNDLDSLYSEDKKVNFMREVNSFIGWAIGNLH
jgi:hypothetical protein